MTHNHQRGSLALAGCLFGILSGAQLNLEHLLHIIICENFPRVKGVPGSAAKGGSDNHEIQAPFCSFRAPNRLRRQINARIPLDYSPQTRKERGNHLYRFTERINTRRYTFYGAKRPVQFWREPEGNDAKYSPLTKKRCEKDEKSLANR